MLNNNTTLCSVQIIRVLDNKIEIKSEYGEIFSSSLKSKFSSLSDEFLRRIYDYVDLFIINREMNLFTIRLDGDKIAFSSKFQFLATIDDELNIQIHKTLIDVINELEKAKMDMASVV